MSAAGAGEQRDGENLRQAQARIGDGIGHGLRAACCDMHRDDAPAEIDVHEKA